MCHRRIEMIGVFEAQTNSSGNFQRGGRFHGPEYVHLIRVSEIQNTELVVYLVWAVHIPWREWKDRWQTQTLPGYAIIRLLTCYAFNSSLVNGKLICCYRRQSVIIHKLPDPNGLIAFHPTANIHVC